MSFDPYQPYGPPVETTVRIVTWNVWGRYGDWAGRQAGIEDALAAAEPDVVCLVESWSAPGDGDPATGDETDETDAETGDETHEPDTQADRVAARLGHPHRLFAGDWQQDGWTSGAAVVSRWPLTDHERQPLRGADGTGVGEALHTTVDGPRGPIDLYVVMLDHPLHASALRQAQVRQLAAFVARTGHRRHPVVVCGDFNAGPDADELRMLTGRSETPEPGLVFYDAWEVAGDGSPGHTWSNRNPLAAPGLYPDRRFDYVLSAWPRAGGAGHPTRCELLDAGGGPGRPPLSDHHGVLAELRY